MKTQEEIKKRIEFIREQSKTTAERIYKVQMKIVGHAEKYKNYPHRLVDWVNYELKCMEEEKHKLEIYENIIDVLEWAMNE